MKTRSLPCHPGIRHKLVALQTLTWKWANSPPYKHNHKADQETATTKCPMALCLPLLPPTRKTATTQTTLKMGTPTSVLNAWAHTMTSATGPTLQHPHTTPILQLPQTGSFPVQRHQLLTHTARIKHNPHTRLQARSIKLQTSPLLTVPINHSHHHITAHLLLPWLVGDHRHLATTATVLMEVGQ